MDNEDPMTLQRLLIIAGSFMLGIFELALGMAVMIPLGCLMAWSFGGTKEENRNNCLRLPAETTAGVITLLCIVQALVGTSLGLAWLNTHGFGWGLVVCGSVVWAVGISIISLVWIAKFAKKAWDWSLGNAAAEGADDPPTYSAVATEELELEEGTAGLAGSSNTTTTKSEEDEDLSRVGGPHEAAGKA